MFHFLETDIREQKKYELICVIKSSLKIAWKTKITFLLSQPLLFFLGQKCISFLETYFFKFPKNLITEPDTKKHRYASTKAANAALVKLTDWIIKNYHVIIYAMFFCKWFKHGQTSNVISSQHGF